VGTADLADEVFGVEPIPSPCIRSCEASSPLGAPAPTARGPAARSAAVAASRIARRAQAARVKVRSAPDSAGGGSSSARRQKLRFQGAEQGRQTRQCADPCLPSTRKACSHVVDGFEFGEPSTKRAAEVLKNLASKVALTSRTYANDDHERHPLVSQYPGRGA